METMLHESPSMKQLATVTKYVSQEQIVGIQSIPVKDLLRPEYYCRQSIDGREKLIPASIGTLGFVSPVVVNVNADRKFIVIDGNSRVEYFRVTHDSEILAVMVDVSLSEEKQLHYLLNESTRINDPNKMMEFLGNISPEDFGLCLPNEQETKITEAEFNDAHNRQITRLMFTYTRVECEEIKVQMNDLKNVFGVNNKSLVLKELIKYYYENANNQPQPTEVS